MYLMKRWLYYFGSNYHQELSLCFSELLDWSKRAKCQQPRRECGKCQSSDSMNCINNIIIHMNKRLSHIYIKNCRNICLFSSRQQEEDACDGTSLVTVNLLGLFFSPYFLHHPQRSEQLFT